MDNTNPLHPEADPFDQLARMFTLENELFGAVNSAHQEMDAAYLDTGYTSVELMRRAWDKLDPEQQQRSFDALLNAYWHVHEHIREAEEIARLAREGGSLLEHDDLEIIDYSLTFADTARIEATGDVPVPLDALSRLVREVKRLTARVRQLESGPGEPGTVS